MDESYVSHELIESERRVVLDYYNFILSCLEDRIIKGDISAMKLGVTVNDKKVQLLALSYPKSRPVGRIQLSDLDHEIKRLTKKLAIDQTHVDEIEKSTLHQFKERI